MDISNKGLIVRLSITQWTGRRYDRKVTEEISKLNKAGDSGRFNKLLVDRKYIAPIQKVGSEARAFHYENTLTYDDSGMRVLPVMNYFHYVEEMAQFEKKFNLLVNQFLNEYETIIVSERIRLGDMYNLAEYPGVEEVKAKYTFRTKYYPLVSGEGVSLDLSKDELTEVKNKMDMVQRENLGKAASDLWIRLRDVVTKVESRLDSGGVFRNTLIENVGKVCALIPKLNITGDEDLEKLGRETMEKLTEASPSAIRSSKYTRSEISNRAKEIRMKIDSIFG